MTAGLKRGRAPGAIRQRGPKIRHTSSIVTRGGIFAPSPSQPVNSSSDTRLLGLLCAFTLQYYNRGIWVSPQPTPGYAGTGDSARCDPRWRQCDFTNPAHIQHSFRVAPLISRWIRSSAINERKVCTSSTDNNTAILFLMQKGAFVL